jgi:hypothetical protein
MSLIKNPEMRYTVNDYVKAFRMCAAKLKEQGFDVSVTPDGLLVITGGSLGKDTRTVAVALGEPEEVMQ